MFKLLLVKLLIYYKGIRFYKSDIEPLSVGFKEMSVQTVDGKSIEFYFHEDEYTDYIYKRGVIKKSVFKTHIVRSVMSNDVDEKLLTFNNLKIVFRSNDFCFKDRDIFIKVLLSIFLDFIKKEIENEKK